MSVEGTERLIRKAIQYAIDNKRSSVTLVHKGNIMKFTEGGFKKWGYELAKREFGARLIDDGPWMKLPNGIVIKDVIADAFLQQILLRPDEYDVIATLNLNGDYISDALAAEVGGIGIAPGANLSDTVAMFEATHGTAPKYAGKDYVNPGSLILSAEMMLRHMGWIEAADLIVASMEKAIAAKTRDLRLCPPDGRRDRSEVFGVCRGDGCADVSVAANQQKAPPRRGFLCQLNSSIAAGCWKPACPWALGHFEADLLAFFQRFETAGLDGGEVCKHILAAVIGGDKAETLGVAEPLDSTCCH